MTVPANLNERTQPMNIDRKELARIIFEADMPYKSETKEQRQHWERMFNYNKPIWFAKADAVIKYIKKLERSTNV